jgi:ABC-type glycerol-3-phosphate transport system substrate-binding protein
MKIASFVMIAAAVGLAGCSTLVSLHPLVSDQQAVFDPALVGVWAEEKGDTVFVVQQYGNNYKIRRIENNNAQLFGAQLFKSGELRILDLVSANDDPFQLAVHTPLRVWIDGSKLRYATLDSAWLKDNARKLLAVQDVGDRALITAPTDAVLRFLLTYGATDTAFEKPSVLLKQ